MSGAFYQVAVCTFQDIALGRPTEDGLGDADT
jgi:hypothetical protein